jgi:hypothetical protein
MERIGEMGQERGPEDGKEKRSKHQGDLIQEQQKEGKKHGSEKLRLRHGSDTSRRKPEDLSSCVAAGLFLKHHNLLRSVCGEITDRARQLWKLVGPGGHPHICRALELGAFLHNENRR